MSRVIKLERRSRALPKDSAARARSLTNVEDVSHELMKEAGERWAAQWAAPVNFSDKLKTSFLDSGCFVLNTLDRLEEVADQLFQYGETLPVIFEGTGWQMPEATPRQKANPPSAAPPGPDSGNHSCEVGVVISVCRGKG
jgi:hypothetical protein